jgi:hypothetical protein
MKANAPEKIYVHRTVHLCLLAASEINITGDDIEYTRTDAFIEKACEYLMKYEFNDSPTIADRRKRVDEFRKYMERK